MAPGWACALVSRLSLARIMDWLQAIPPASTTPTPTTAATFYFKNGRHKVSPFVSCCCCCCCCCCYPAKGTKREFVMVVMEHWLQCVSVQKWPTNWWNSSNYFSFFLSFLATKLGPKTQSNDGLSAIDSVIIAKGVGGAALVIDPLASRLLPLFFF